MLAADVNTVTDWMQGWGSLISVIVSLVAVLFTGFLLRHEINVRREEKADADAAQARLIAISIKPGGDSPFRAGEVENHSAAPVHNVKVYSAAIRDFHDGVELGTILAGKSKGWEYPLDTIGNENSVLVTFLDASGLRWALPEGGHANHQPGTADVPPGLRTAVRQLLRFSRPVLLVVVLGKRIHRWLLSRLERRSADSFWRYQSAMRISRGHSAKLSEVMREARQDRKGRR